MSPLRSILALAVVACVAMPLSAASGQAAPASDWSGVEKALGRKGAPQPGDVIKFSFPRSDLSVSLGNVQIKPALALGSWIAFKRTGKNDAMAMGDLVLLESEVNPVISALQAGGIEQTALHNHLLNSTPRTMYLHISGHGDADALATTIRSALENSRTPLEAPVAGAAATFELDTAALAHALGYGGRVNGGVYQVAVPRAEKITDNGMEVPASMGVATAINFQPTGGGRAAITGDFVMTAGEVNKVIRALHTAGVDVTGLHSHMLNENPRLFFMHFWANDDAIALAKGLKAALSHTNSAKGS